MSFIGPGPMVPLYSNYSNLDKIVSKRLLTIRVKKKLGKLHESVRDLSNQINQNNLILNDIQISITNERVNK